MILRNYQPGDYPQVEALWKETGIYNKERGDTADIILRCNALGGEFLILEDESLHRIIGTRV